MLVVFALTKSGKQSANGLNCFVFLGCLHLQALFQGVRKYVIFIDRQKIMSILLFIWVMRSMMIVVLFFCWGCKDKEPPKEDPVVIVNPGVSGYQQYGVPMDSVPQGRDI